MIKIIKNIDNFIDTMWRRTCATIFYYFDSKVEEEDIDWLNMQNNIIEDKKDHE